MLIYHTWVYVFYVPSEKTVEKSVKDHHEEDHKEVELIAFNGRRLHVVPLHTNALYLVESKILGP